MFRVFTKTLPGDTVTPVTLYDAYVGGHPGFLLESREEGKGRYTFMGRSEGTLTHQDGQTRMRLREDGGTVVLPDGPFEGVREALAYFGLVEPSPLPFSGGLVGFLGYDTIRALEDLPDDNPDEIGIPAMELMICTKFLAIDHLHHTLTLAVLVEDGPEASRQAARELSRMEQQARKPSDLPYEEPGGILTVQDSLNRQEYMDAVARIRDYIVAGDVFQTVISRRYTVDTDKSPFGIYRNLRQINPSPYLFYLDFGDYQLLGSSPEMLAEKRGDLIRTCPIAGTRRRSSDPREDERLARELLSDEKERAEHLMLVDLGRNDMGRVARPGTVEVTRLMEVHRYSHVMHLVSLVEGRSEPGLTGPEILGAFIPAGTLSGAPKIRAMEIIDELEPVRRSFYGGCVGYFGFDGDMDTCIAIRSMVTRDGRAYLQAGAGIVYDSDPQTEFEETESKLKAALRALE